MDRDIFISYDDEDGAVARALAAELRTLGQSTWTYEEDGLAGLSYLSQINQAIEACRAFLLLASPTSVKAHQVIKEVEQAYEREKLIIPVRVGLTHQQFIAANPILRMASGTAVTVAAEEGNLGAIAKRIAATLMATYQSDSATAPSGTQQFDAPVSAASRAGAAPIPPPAIAHTAAPSTDIQPSSAVSSSTAVGLSGVPRELSRVEARTPLRSRISCRVGIAGQIVWAAFLGFLSLGMWVQGGGIGGLIAMMAATAIFLCGMLLGSSWIGLSRSSGVNSNTLNASVRRLHIFTIISSIVFSAAAGRQAFAEGRGVPGAVLLAVVLVVPTAVFVVLVWYGLQKYTQLTDTPQQ